MSDQRGFVWRELYFPRPLSPAMAVESVRALAGDPHSPAVVLEARGSKKAGVRFLLGTHKAVLPRVVRALGVVAVGLSTPRLPVVTARKVVVSNRQRPLDVGGLEVTAPAILSALSAANGAGEELVLQVVLGARLSGLVVPSTARQPVPVARLLVGYPPNNRDGRMDAEARTALARKVCEPGFCAVVRVGVVAKSLTRRRELVLGLLGGLDRLEAPGVTISLTGEKVERLDLAKSPWRWPLRLNIHEVAAISAMPVGDGELPGLPPVHPRLLAPPVGVFTPNKNRVVVAKATAPGVTGDITRSNEALVRHLHVSGPTGTGKSVLLANLALEDIAAGRGVAIVEPKGDLVADVLARIPRHRHGDVVVLDPTNPDGIVGLNPLADDGSISVELRADSILSIFTDLFGDALGVRTTDILHSCLLTLARQPDASLIQIPRLLTDSQFRARVIGKVAGDVALGSFWAWYQALGDIERMTVIAPLMNKLRAVLLRENVRRVLGQSKPRFHVRQVFSENKILLVPLPVATLGSEGSTLLGSLVVSQLWQTAQERALVSVVKRRPVSVVLDEAQQFMRFPTDLSEALAMSRSYGVGWTLAHQAMSQLPTAMRLAVLSGCRSRVIFQTSQDDAKTFAAETGGQLAPEDFTALPAFHIYASMFENGSVQPYASAKTGPLGDPTCDPNLLRAASAKRYGRTAEEIEAEFSGDSESVGDVALPGAVSNQDGGLDGQRARKPSGSPS